MRAILPALLGGFIIAATPLASAQTGAGAATNAPPVINAPYLAPAPISPPPGSSLPPGLGPPGHAQAQEEIADIRPPFFYFHILTLLWMALAVLGLIALLVLLWMWFKPHRLLSPKSAYDLTLEKLVKARTMLNEENPGPYAIFVSEVIRTYLGQRFQTPSTRRTTEEFLRQMQADRTTPLAEYRDLLRGFLQACDLVKFARYHPTLEELEQVQQRAWNFVTSTKPQPAPGGVHA